MISSRVFPSFTWSRSARRISARAAPLLGLPFRLIRLSPEVKGRPCIFSFNSCSAVIPLFFCAFFSQAQMRRQKAVWARLLPISHSTI